MGFDLYGVKPNVRTPEPPKPEMNGEKWTDEELEQYDKWDEWRTKSGGYFRANVWFWRPLWGFVTAYCDDILTEKDILRGEYNDGHRISKTKSERIANRLYSMLDNGQIDRYEKEYKEDQEALPDGDWNRHYPFDKQVVREFADFCANCGGFEIC